MKNNGETFAVLLIAMVLLYGVAQYTHVGVYSLDSPVTPPQKMTPTNQVSVVIEPVTNDYTVVTDKYSTLTMLFEPAVPYPSNDYPMYEEQVKVKWTNGTNIGGFYEFETPDTIYVSSHSEMNQSLIIAHEMCHLILDRYNKAHRNDTLGLLENEWICYTIGRNFRLRDETLTQSVESELGDEGD